MQQNISGDFYAHSVAYFFESLLDGHDRQQIEVIGYGNVYPDTTGLEQVDYRFTDQWADLPGSERYYTEQLVFIPSGFICYRPPEFAPAVGPLPAQRNGFVTFCSFNNNQKINNKVMDMWAAVLRNVPNSRLLLKFKCGNDPAVRGYYLNEFGARGVHPSRICLTGWLKQLDHLNLAVSSATKGSAQYGHIQQLV